MYCILPIPTVYRYMFLSWLVAQMLTSDGTEGRSIQSILLPTPLRRLLFRQRDEVQEGDLRGEERQRSEVEGSVRAYKVSKTFSGKKEDVISDPDIFIIFIPSCIIYWFIY